VNDAAQPPLLHSRALQVSAVIVAFVAGAALNAANDGLWFGDAPVHAASGLFWWDLITMRPASPIEFAVRYFARYPVIQPTTYPPLLHVVEGLVFAIAGPSPYVARAIVLVTGIATGLYTMQWGRRWIAPPAGWAGAMLGFVPGILTWSNAVMLNMPATALGLASIYYIRRWLESARTKHLALSVGLMAAVLVTYYPGAVAFAVIAAFAISRRRAIRVDRKLIWVGAAIVAACVPLLIAIVFSPVHTARHLPSLAFLTQASTWILYWWILPQVMGWPLLALSLAGAVAGLLTPRWRSEAALLATWFGALIVVLSLQPARDPRYLLLAAPALVLAAAVGIAAIAERWRAPRGVLSVIAIVVMFALGLVYARSIRVPRVTGFREAAEYLREVGPRDAVLYDGPRSQLFTFYVRMLDPAFERRVTEAGHLLYSYGPRETFTDWAQTSNVRTREDVVTMVRSRCGCQWVAIEEWSQSADVTGRRLLREAVVRPEFEFVRSFPVSGVAAREVRLYRLVDPAERVATIDLSFPSFSSRQFRGVTPITRD
jgi:hypothetical protein